MNRYLEEPSLIRLIAQGAQRQVPRRSVGTGLALAYAWSDVPSESGNDAVPVAASVYHDNVAFPWDDVPRRESGKHSLGFVVPFTYPGADVLTGE